MACPCINKVKVEKSGKALIKTIVRFMNDLTSNGLRTMSHPILRIKLNALNSCLSRDQSHTQVDKLQKYHHGVSYITINIIT